MKRAHISVTLAAALLASGCAQSYRPVVDLSPGQSRDHYEQDLSQCRQLAEQIDPAKEAAAGAAAASIFGAVVGVALGAFTHAGAGYGAGVGGLSGLFSGGAAGAG